MKLLAELVDSDLKEPGTATSVNGMPQIQSNTSMRLWRFCGHCFTHELVLWYQFMNRVLLLLLQFV